MNPGNRWTPILIIAFSLAGFGLGLAYSWAIAPVEYVNADPALLRDDFKDQYRIVISAAYIYNRDLDRARARLALLGDPDPLQALSAQAQQMLAAGAPFDRVQQLAQLAADLQAGKPDESVIITQPPSAAPQPPVATSQPPTGTPSAESSASVRSTDTPTVAPILTATLQPSRTPTATSGAAFALVGQDSICENASRSGLLQILVMDARDRQIPGMEIIVTWNGGEDHFFTGFKPELGDGYADFQMQAEVVYTVRLVAGSAQVTNITAPSCSGSDGEGFDGDVRLRFQQP